MHKILLITLVSMILAGCANDDSVIDSVFTGDLPHLERLRLSAYEFDTDSIGTGGIKSPDDPVVLPFRISITGVSTSDAGLDRVRCTVVSSGSPRPNIDTILTFSQAMDSLQADLELHIRRGDVGVYEVEVTGWDTKGRSLNRLRSTFRVRNGSYAPVLTNLSAPDTVIVPDTGFVLLDFQVTVTDSSGIKDIRRVQFNTFLPDGRPSSSNPFQMFDDGLAVHGDAVADDGIYSLRVQLPASTARGRYRFEFQAFDFGNLPSNIIIHFVEVI
ncbi:MAG: hypothetical protein GXO82_07615 [Chlorobi bacterium]|nr:hypothetical protein [Chlorobiota bacterium]